MMPPFLHIVLVMAGGALGAGARFLTAHYAVLWWGKSFPYATLLVNAGGSFVMGMLFVLIVEKQLIPVEWRYLVMVGFLGAFTTFSTFSMETLELVQLGEWAKALWNIVLNVTLSITAALLGVVLMKNLV